MINDAQCNYRNISVRFVNNNFEPISDARCGEKSRKIFKCINVLVTEIIGRNASSRDKIQDIH